MSDIVDVKRRVVSFISEIDAHELACRIAEGVMGLRRPEGASAEQAMMGFEHEDRSGFYEAAHKACEYVAEQINAVVQPS